MKLSLPSAEPSGRSSLLFSGTQGENRRDSGTSWHITTVKKTAESSMVLGYVNQIVLLYSLKLGGLCVTKT